MRPMLVILGKDLRQRLRDRSAIVTAIVVPLVLASIFGLVFHNAIGGKVTFKLGLVDLDHGPAAAAFSRSALGPLERQGLIDVRPQGSLAAGRDAADRDRVAATIVIPAGFSAALATGRAASLRVLGSVDSPIGTQVAQAIAGAFGDAISTGRIAAAAGAGGGASGALGLARATTPRIRPREFSPGPKAPQPIAVADISTRSRQLDAGTFYAAGMAVFFLFFTVQFGISSIHDERRDGTLARMLAAPIRPQAVLGGKLLTSLALGALSLTVLALATHLLLSAHWGNVLGVAILIGAGVIAATAVMALVATVARTPDQAQSWQAMVALVLGMLGGTFFPVAQAGAALATLSLLTPQAWFLRGVENMTGGRGAGAVLGPAAAMLTFAAVTGSVALMRSSRLVER